MKVVVNIILITIFMLYAEVGIAATIHVPTDRTTIQAGINAAVDGDVVVVADGVYTGDGNKNIDFNGKKITVQSENGPFSCIIDCEGTGRGFYFHLFEKNDSVLSGFTILNGNLDRTLGYGGGILCNMSEPTITNCIIENCDATQWGGGVAIMGDIDTSIDAIISNSIITNNWALVGGGGIGVGGQGGDVLMVNCTLVGNDCGTDDSTICTGAAGLGIGTGNGSATAANSIFWNTANGTGKNEITGYASVTYSLIRGGYTGVGNISCDPISCDPGFVDPSIDDYHLTAISLCIDSGTSDGAPNDDIDGDSRPQGDGFDIGADEYVINDTCNYDGICNTPENCSTCPEDCIGKNTGKPTTRYCCGDGVCEAIEDSFNCAVDCGPPPVCGDGICEDPENSCSCPEDCGPPPYSETNCVDGIDNDCDSGVDCDDEDCSSDFACTCKTKGELCSSDEECCSNDCRGIKCK